MNIACPDRQNLIEWSLGFLDESQQDAIASHVSSCDSCKSSLDLLDMPGDQILEQIQGLEPRSPRSGEVSQEHCVTQEQASIPDAVLAPEAVTAPADLTPGTVVGPYEILAELRRGGMGAVYRARHTLLNRTVAFKVLPSDRFCDPRAVARFRREMESAGAVDHPNLVRSSDAGESGGTHYLVMEYIDGVDLDRLVRKQGPLAPARACEIIRQAALGLEHAPERIGPSRHQAVEYHDHARWLREGTGSWPRRTSRK